MAGLIPPQVLETIRAASDIVEVIGSYIPLKKAGANYVALCPFHREKSPSFNVNPHREIFHCFGCHKGGDVFTFVKEYESITFIEAVRRLAERAHIVLEVEHTPGQQQARHLKETLLQIHEQIALRWQMALANDASGQIARDYLARRHVTEDAVKLFRIGYAPDAWDDTVNWAKSKGYDLPMMEQAGLVVRKEGSDHFYDRFRGRLMFPICDEQGRVVAFSGRILTGDEKTAKYVNSPETPIFTKGKVFYGLDKSKRAILEEQFAVVCEGQLDLIACFMGGVKNIVAPQGTAFTPDHARILKRYCEEVVLCFDSDLAGQKASVRVLDSLLSSGLAIRVATVPAPHDPDSFIQEKGGPAFVDLIQNAEGFFDYFLNRLCAIHDSRTDRGRLAILAEFGAAINKTQNAVLIDKYAQMTALRLGVNHDALVASFSVSTAPQMTALRQGVNHEAVLTEFRKAQQSAAADVTSQQEVPPETELTEPPPPPPKEPEPMLLKLVLQEDAPIEWIKAYLDLCWIQHPTVHQIVTARISAMENQSWLGLAAFLGECEDESTRNLITELLSDRRPIPNPDQQLQDIVKRLRDQFLDRQIATIKQLLKRPEMSDAEQVRRLQQQQLLRQTKTQPLSPLDQLTF